jgi:Holliday junction DNA helicase RuvA
MISYLEGEIKKAADDYIILINNGIGYQVFLSAKTRGGFKESERVLLFVHEYLRENARELYGFNSHSELEFFWRLLDISGVGPRMAMNIIALGSIEELVKNIEKGNIDYISQVSGVGKKTAQKIVIELKGKLDLSGTEEEDQEVIMALKNLGYSKLQAREAVRKVSKEMTDTGDKVREALRYLSK